MVMTTKSSDRRVEGDDGGDAPLAVQLVQDFAHALRRLAVELANLHIH